MKGESNTGESIKGAKAPGERMTGWSAKGDWKLKKNFETLIFKLPKLRVKIMVVKELKV